MSKQIVLATDHTLMTGIRPLDYSFLGTLVTIPDDQWEDWEHVLSEFQRVQAEMKVAIRYEKVSTVKEKS